MAELPSSSGCNCCTCVRNLLCLEKKVWKQKQSSTFAHTSSAVRVPVFFAGGADLTEASQIRQWVVSVYFAMTTVTTVGYGDITAHSATEQVRQAGLSPGHTQYTLLWRPPW